MLKYDTKQLFFTFGLISLILTGCSDKKQDENKTEHTATQETTTTPKIEVVENKNQKEIKIEVVENTNKKNEAFYYDDLKKEEKDMISTRTSLDAYTHIRSPYERVKISLIRQQLSKNFRLRCSACHDDYANGIVGPSLLGKDANFIYKKIIEFKENKINPLMTDLINQMSNEEINQIAKEIYEFNKQVQQLGAKE
jgi:cytochrome c553